MPDLSPAECVTFNLKCDEVCVTHIMMACEEGGITHLCFDVGTCGSNLKSPHLLSRLAAVSEAR